MKSALPFTWPLVSISRIGSWPSCFYSLILPLIATLQIFFQWRIIELLLFATWKWKCLSLSCIWLFATPRTAASQAPLSMEFSRQESWSGLPFPSPGHLPDPGVRPRSPALQADSLPSEPPGWLHGMHVILPFASLTKEKTTDISRLSVLRDESVEQIDSSRECEDFCEWLSRAAPSPEIVISQVCSPQVENHLGSQVFLSLDQQHQHLLVIH